MLVCWRLLLHLSFRNPDTDIPDNYVIIVQSDGKLTPGVIGLSSRVTACIQIQFLTLRLHSHRILGTLGSQTRLAVNKVKP